MYPQTMELPHQLSASHVLHKHVISSTVQIIQIWNHGATEHYSRCMFSLPNVSFALVIFLESRGFLLVHQTLM